MSNPAMEQPTEEQEMALAKMLADMGQTVRSIENITGAIGTLRRELNNSAVLLSGLKRAIGPESYTYYTGGSRETWHSLIDKQMADIEKALK
jgi:hypothetical protein